MLMMWKHSVTMWKGGLLMGEYRCAGRSILGGALGVCPAAHRHCMGFGAGSLPGTPKNNGYRWADRLQLGRSAERGRAGRLTSS